MTHRTIYDTDHTTPLKEGHKFNLNLNAPPNVVEAAREMQPIIPQLEGRTLYFQPGKVITMPPEPQVNPNEILHNMLDHIHDGNREELVGQMILMLGWLHQGGTMPNISKDTVTSTTLWIIPEDK